ncbi:hypothetical protein A2960_03060 [Candidatus Gottesmanbacteria bacterium RIFCSPLOWO2_01_FULL_39_12b]|uniref:Rod shape-determining protein MreD n=1 Tax=Candidatus Gottesmanbacteria bacterium RIFCSPLOWO2_01_FULL_39_12b TaxID=1798388 RepID=A0A1F6AQX6_9BACT|nr:MAG: hypothetical protein A2960_03060 [Candidatus Gottesmanbacteria bacterium RIFCSPLOWO2_01_FULL_39_12b]
MIVILFLLFFSGIIIESTLINFPLTLILVTILTSIRGEKIVPLVFIIGLVLDLFTLNLLGSNSLFFLLTTWVAVRYQKKMSSGNLFYPLSFITVLMTLYNLIFYKKFDYLSLLAGITVTAIFFLFLTKLFPHIFGDRAKLKI